MPRINIKKGEKWVPKTGQEIILDQIKAGKAIPILSNSVSNELILGNHQQLIRDYAEYAQYPLSDHHNLARITQYLSVMQGKGATGSLVVKKDYLDYVKSALYRLVEGKGTAGDLLAEVAEQFDALDFSELAGRLGYPEFAEPPDDPWLILASLDLPVYLTTSYHRFLEVALGRAGKQPRTAVCRWNRQSETLPDILAGDYQPSKEQPLVYHLYGLDAHPKSLVLTEDDHLEFLVAVAQDRDRIPPRVRQALTESSLLLLGYDLQDWDFRTLFWSLLKQRSIKQQSISVLYLQLKPGEAEKQYLQKYLGEAECEVFWGDIRQYAQELYQAVFV